MITLLNYEQQARNELSFLHPSAFILHSYVLISSVRQHSPHTLKIAVRDQNIDIQVAFPFIGLLGQDVACMRMPALDLAGGGNAKSLCRSLMGFQLWHDCSFSKSLLSKIESQISEFQNLSNFKFEI
jgi:hypothetical protein